MKSCNYILGIDEAGRGPLAGRVFVGAVLLPKKHKNLFSDIPAPLRDSKKLTQTQREAWMAWMKKKEIIWTKSAISSRTIDRINISRATQRAAQKSYEKITRQTSVKKLYVIADGAIKVVIEKRHVFKNEPKADETYPAVSLASIVAKVHRDREMQRLHKKFPQYGFDRHKGYGTLAHRNAIKKHGPCKIHRLTFIRNCHTMGQLEAKK